MFDADPWIFNCQSHTLDLLRSRARPHRRDDHLTKMAPVHFDKNAKCPNWLKFLDWAMQGDEELVGYLQRLAGYAMTGSTREQVLPIFFGDGSNGKSTFLDTLMAVWGEYGKPSAPFLLEEKQRGPDHPTAVAALRGARLVVVSENSKSTPLQEALVKQLTGDEVLSARFMGRDFFEFKPTFTIIYACNHRPEIRGTDHGIWRRVHLVPWMSQVKDEERDPNLKAKLVEEAAGILNWSLQGCKEWIASGLMPPRRVLEATRAYRDEMDAIGQFVADCCITGNGRKVDVADLYRAYQDWTKTNGQGALSNRKFGVELEKRGYPGNRTNTARYREGLSLHPHLVQRRDAWNWGDASDAR
jgi:putative DNA primase/helicase